MKAILEFNLPEDKDTHTMALKGSEYFSALSQLDQKLRSFLKYGGAYTSAEAVAQDVRDFIHEYVNFDEIS